MLTLCERAFYAFWGKNTEKGRKNLRVLDMDWLTRTNNGMKGIERNKSDPKHVHCLCQSSCHTVTMPLTRSTLGTRLAAVRVPSWQKIGPPARSACMSSPFLWTQGKCLYIVELLSLVFIEIEVVNKTLDVRQLPNPSTTSMLVKLCRRFNQNKPTDLPLGF